MLARAFNCELSIQSVTQLNNPVSQARQDCQKLFPPALKVLFIFDLPFSQCVYVCVCVVVAQLCLTLCDPMGCGSSDSSVHGVLLQLRRLDWLAIPCSRGASQPKDCGRDCLQHCEQILYCLSHWESFIQPMCYVKTTSLSVLVLGSSFSPAVRYYIACSLSFFCCYFFLTFKIGFLPAKKIVLLLLYPQEQQVTLQM